jgi:Ca2+-transporting ATPase
MVLLVTISSAFIDRDRAATEVIAYVETFVPLSGDMQAYIFDTVASVIKERGQAGAIAFLILVWVTLQCFTTLISATNRAWGTAGYSWWRRPLKSLMLLGITAGAVLLSIGAPMLAQIARDWLFPMNDFRSWVYTLLSFFIPLLVLFLGLSLFYQLAPRRPTRFSEVWVAALCATALLLAAENLFVIYLKHFATLNAVYGAFGGIMALLLWIYLSGGIFIFGACLCAAQAEVRSAPADTIPARNT